MDRISSLETLYSTRPSGGGLINGTCRGTVVAKCRKSCGLDPVPETHMYIERKRERDGTGAGIFYTRADLESNCARNILEPAAEERVSCYVGYFFVDEELDGIG